jgi:hypothetical protein
MQTRAVPRAYSRVFSWPLQLLASTVPYRSGAWCRPTHAHFAHVFRVGKAVATQWRCVHATPVQAAIAHARIIFQLGNDPAIARVPSEERVRIAAVVPHGLFQRRPTHGDVVLARAPPRARLLWIGAVDLNAGRRLRDLFRAHYSVARRKGEEQQEHTVQHV